MDLHWKFREFIKKEGLFQQKDKLLIAVSGGVDSVVLCALCKAEGYDFVMAHCNFQLRGPESERDAAFIKELADKLGVELFVKNFETKKYAADNKLSIQVAARELRYAWFYELCETTNHKPQTGRYILTAHHADDNIETLLMNFFKGTGISGLRGILPAQGKIIRPLLFARKTELSAYAITENLSYVEDSSNLSDIYTRNYFRNKLIPDLQKVYPQVEDNLAGNLQRFREIEWLYHQSIDLLKKKLLERKGNEVHIPVLKLNKTQPLSTIVYEIIRDYGFTAHQVTDVIGLLQSDSGKYIKSLSHRILKNRNWLIISPHVSTGADNILLEENDSTVEFSVGKMEIKRISMGANFTHDLKDKLPTGSYGQARDHIASLDIRNICFPLLLRKWRTGDYFYPLGMNRKKKLSRFFIDRKLSLLQKEKVWVVESDRKIIWVVGMRIDERFKITESTKTILQLDLTGPQ